MVYCKVLKGMKTRKTNKKGTTAINQDIDFIFQDDSKVKNSSDRGASFLQAKSIFREGQTRTHGIILARVKTEVDRTPINNN